jgi:Flp pilus assembly protein TadB
VAALAAASTALLLPGVPRPPAGARGPSQVAPVGQDGATGWSAVAVGAGVAVAVLLLAPGWLAVVACPAGLVAWRRARGLETAAARRRRERVERELPHLVDLVGALVSAGAAPAEALASVCGVVSAESASVIRPWVGRLALGSDPVAVWAELARHPQLGRLGTALHRASVSGAPVSEALHRLSEDLRTARRADVHRRVRQVEVRAAAPLGACLLPAFVLVGVVPLVAGAARNLTLG